ncbi:MAG: metallophosphoesterase [Gemmatimonadales bacterium]|nr:metallophosphoesterase [Gemmatimonadales bacterium]
MTTLVHLSDIHFGRDVDLNQVGVLESLIPTLGPTAVVISGDLTQRARHGELQRALAFVETLRKTAPVHVVPGNHDVQWWETPLGILGRDRLYAKYRQYFGAELSPRTELPGVVIESALTSHGVAFGSLTWKFWRDTAVKGHLPAAEVARAAARFAAAPADALRVLVLHHNVLRGEISRRMGLARWRAAQSALAASGADLILCGHDHQESIGTLGGGVAVSTASTHTGRTRGHRPSAFNLIEATAADLSIRHFAWDRAARRFEPQAPTRIPRRPR